LGRKSISTKSASFFIPVWNWTGKRKMFCFLSGGRSVASDDRRCAERLRNSFCVFFLEDVAVGLSRRRRVGKRAAPDLRAIVLREILEKLHEALEEIALREQKVDREQRSRAAT